jgi:hypothetical protein
MITKANTKNYATRRGEKIKIFSSKRIIDFVLLLCPVILVSIICASLFVIWADHRFDEQLYVSFLKDYYLRESYLKSGSWPKDLGGTAKYFHDPLYQHGKRWHGIEAESHPVLTVDRAVGKEFKGHVQFHWLFGTTESISVVDPKD